MKRKILRAVALAFTLAAIVLLLGVPASAAMEPMEPIPPLVPELPSSPIEQGENPTSPNLPPSDGDPGGGPGSVDQNLINVEVNGEGSDMVRILVLMTILSLLPSILIMMTSFTRLAIVFSLLRNAIGLQQTPPNQVMVGLALFLSLFIMRPVITDIYEDAYQPFAEGTMSSEEFIETAQVPLKRFMIQQLKPEDVNMFVEIAGETRPENDEELSMAIIVPSFIVSEIKRGFTIGFFVYIPFLILDMVVASALMSMGMMMLPPVTISLPFKLMLFVLVDGWGLLIKTVVTTFNMGP